MATARAGALAACGISRRPGRLRALGWRAGEAAASIVEHFEAVDGGGGGGAGGRVAVAVGGVVGGGF